MASDVTAWAANRLGAQAAAIQRAVSLALRDAQDSAVRAQLVQELNSKDPYGHTLFVHQHERLNERCKGIAGVQLRKPSGVRSRFEFPVVDDTNVVLVPIRISNDPRVRHDDTRLNLSRLRLALLETGSALPDPQRSIDDLMRDQEAVDAEYEDAIVLGEELAKVGRAVVIAFGSTVDGIFELGWGDLHITDAEAREVSWSHWETLPLIDSSEVGESTVAPLNVVPSSPSLTRFDENSGDDEDVFGLTLRSPLAPDPSSEQEAPELETGTTDPEGE